MLSHCYSVRKNIKKNKKLINILFISLKLILLEELPEEEAFPVFIETQAFTSLVNK